MNNLLLASGPNELALDAETGRVASLRNERRTFLPRAIGSGPIRFHLPLTDYVAHTVDSIRTRPTVHASSESVTFEFPNLLGARGPTGVSAHVEVRAVGDGAFEFRCRLHNGSAQTIPQIFFPCLGGFVPVDGTEDAVTFAKSRMFPWKQFAACDPNERGKFLRHQSRPEFLLSANTSYRAGMKWMDFGGASAGVSLYSKEKASTAQFMRVSTESPHRETARTIDLSWVFYPFVKPGESWKSPMFILYPHEGDWRRGVLKFKEHADRTFHPVGSTPDRDASIGQQSFWISWHYQDWQHPKYTFRDIPDVAAEARAAGIRHMTLWRATELDFCLPHVIRKPLGTAADLRRAVEESRRRGVEVSLLVTCHLIREDTIGEQRNPREWFKENVAGHRPADNYSYHPTMTPSFPVVQFGHRYGQFACAGSREWRKAFFEFLDQLTDEWGFRGIMFDQSMECSGLEWAGLCFNPLHQHRPDETTTLLAEVLAEARRRLVAKFGPEAALIGEVQWDAGTEWMDLTDDWLPFPKEENSAPFFMAFPRARQCVKCTDYLPQINRIFCSGHWLDLHLEDGQGRLGNYPELTRYLASLAAFKERFSKFFNQRDQYLFTLGARCPGDSNLWIRSHRSGSETLTLATDADGAAKDVEVELILEKLLGVKRARLSVYSRELDDLSKVVAADVARVRLRIPKDDFVAVVLRPE